MKPLRLSATASLSAPSSITSAAVINAGAREREMRKCSDRLSLRALMCPYASSTPCSARMRLPATRSSMSCLLAAGFLNARISSSTCARWRASHRGVVTRQHAHVDHAHCAALHLLEALLERGLQVTQFLHRPDAHRPLRAPHRRDVDLGLVDALADPLVLDGTAALLRHAL